MHQFFVAHVDIEIRECTGEPLNSFGYKFASDDIVQCREFTLKVQRAVADCLAGKCNSPKKINAHDLGKTQRFDVEGDDGFAQSALVKHLFEVVVDEPVPELFMTVEDALSDFVRKNAEWFDAVGYDPVGHDTAM